MASQQPYNKTTLQERTLLEDLLYFINSHLADKEKKAERGP